MFILQTLHRCYLQEAVSGLQRRDFERGLTKSGLDAFTLACGSVSVWLRRAPAGLLGRPDRSSMFRPRSGLEKDLCNYLKAFKMSAEPLKFNGYSFFFWEGGGAFCAVLHGTTGLELF